MPQRLALYVFAAVCLGVTPARALVDPVCSTYFLTPHTPFVFDPVMRTALRTVAEGAPPLDDETLGGTIDAYLLRLGFTPLPNMPGVRRWRSASRRVEVQVTFLASTFGPRGSLTLRSGDTEVDYAKMANGRALRFELDGEIATFRERFRDWVRRWRGGYRRTFDAMAIEVLHHEHVHVLQSRVLPSHRWVDAEVDRLGREQFLATHGARARAAILISEFQAHGQSPRTTPQGLAFWRAWRRFEGILASSYPGRENLTAVLGEAQKLLAHYDVGGAEVLEEALEWLAHGSTMATIASQPDQLSQ